MRFKDLNFPSLDDQSWLLWSVTATRSYISEEVHIRLWCTVYGYDVLYGIDLTRKYKLAFKRY